MTWLELPEYGHQSPPAWLHHVMQLLQYELLTMAAPVTVIAAWVELSVYAHAKNHTCDLTERGEVIMLQQLTERTNT